MRRDPRNKMSHVGSAMRMLISDEIQKRDGKNLMFRMNLL